MKKNILFLVVGVVLLAPSLVSAATLTNGYWRGGFEDCPEDSECNIGRSDSCWGGISPIWWGGTCGDACSGTRESEVTSAAAHSGNRGYRMWFGTDNWDLSDPLAAGIIPNSNDVWVRGYFRFPTNLDVSVGKHIYIFSDGGSECHFCSQWTLGGDLRYEGVNCWGSYTVGNNLYDNINTNAPCYPNCPVTNNVYDDQWHSWEFYYGKSDTTYRFWIDGILIYERTDYNFQLGDDGPWVQFQVYTNTGQRTQSVCTNIDMDDFAVANTSYTGFVQDAQGNNMIGPISTTCGNGVCDPGEICLADSCCNGVTYNTATQVCCSGTIYPGDCCDDSDCTSPDTCQGYVCTASLSADLNQDGSVNSIDFGIMMSYWGYTSYPSADLNQDGAVNTVDFGIMMSQWG